MNFIIIWHSGLDLLNTKKDKTTTFPSFIHFLIYIYIIDYKVQIIIKMN